MPRPAVHPITSPRTWRLLVAPARIEIIEAMRITAPCSIAEIAAIVDRPADALYRHVQKLLEAGLVVSRGTRRSGRRSEQVFDLVADDFRFAFRDGSGRAANKAFEQCANSLLKATIRAVRDSARANRLAVSEGERSLVINYELGWLTPAAFAELHGLLLQVKRLMDGAKRTREGQLFLSAIVVTPVTRKRGARETAGRRTGARAAEPDPTGPRRGRGAS